MAEGSSMVVKQSRSEKAHEAALNNLAGRTTRISDPGSTPAAT
jgi:hypothetical protein